MTAGAFPRYCGCALAAGAEGIADDNRPRRVIAKWSDNAW
jgi:hypothetical protein